MISFFLDNGVTTTPKRGILSFVFTVLCLNKSLNTNHKRGNSNFYDDKIRKRANSALFSLSPGQTDSKVDAS